MINDSWDSEPFIRPSAQTILYRLQEFMKLRVPTRKESGFGGSMEAGLGNLRGNHDQDSTPSYSLSMLPSDCNTQAPPTVSTSNETTSTMPGLSLVTESSNALPHPKGEDSGFEAGDAPTAGHAHSELNGHLPRNGNLPERSGKSTDLSKESVRRKENDPPASKRVSNSPRKTNNYHTAQDYDETTV